ncbi:lipase family protein [Nocardia sp. NPDC051570]|uniref:lipase family protein n=1 Tax=Nocardia sp. NPDC051570 TaxID=3364324 RepID=UPI0037B0F166
MTVELPQTGSTSIRKCGSRQSYTLSTRCIRNVHATYRRRANLLGIRRYQFLLRFLQRSCCAIAMMRQASRTLIAACAYCVFSAVHDETYACPSEKDGTNMFTSRPRRYRYGFAVTVAAVCQVALAAIASAAPCPCASLPRNPNSPIGYWDQEVSDNYQPIGVRPRLPWYQLPGFPQDDPFYHPPAQAFVDKNPGDLIEAREIVPAYFAIVPYDMDAWQLSYRSTDGHGNPIPAVTTVIKPKGDNGGRPRNLVSYQVDENSTAPQCKPSYTIQMGSFFPGWGGQSGTNHISQIPILESLASGWAISIPDHQGPNEGFADGPTGARVTLDGIRAAENFPAMGLGRTTQVGMVGDSGGAIPTGHAAELRRSYAPELNIVGAAHNGTPADIKALVDYANNQMTSALIFTGLVGISKAYPEFGQYFDQHANDVGKVWRNYNWSTCMVNSTGIFPFMNIKGIFDSPDFTLEPPVAQLLDELRMGKATPDMPVFMNSAVYDWVSPIRPIDDLVNGYCTSSDARVDYRRNIAAETVLLYGEAIIPAMNWLNDRFQGKPLNGCNRQDSPVTTHPAELADFESKLSPEGLDCFRKEQDARRATAAQFETGTPPWENPQFNVQTGEQK